MRRPAHEVPITSIDLARSSKTVSRRREPERWIGPPPPQAEVSSSLPTQPDIERYRAAARTGREELLEQLERHTETDPSLTAGDIDANWESAYSTGDEAPGGDNPTPGQDVVDEIGAALGVSYGDTEELHTFQKLNERDRHRWERNPASSDDYRGRVRSEEGGE